MGVGAVGDSVTGACLAGGVVTVWNLIAGAWHAFIANRRRVARTLYAGGVVTIGDCICIGTHHACRAGVVGSFIIGAFHALCVVGVWHCIVRAWLA